MPILTFTSGHPPYNAGEVASFTDDQAEALVAAGAPVLAVNDNVPTAADVTQADDPPAPGALPSNKSARRAQPKGAAPSPDESQKDPSA